MKNIIKAFCLSFLLLMGCFDIHGNTINAQVKVDVAMCDLIESIQSTEEAPIDENPKEDSPDLELVAEWGACEFNEDCETSICMCQTCVDMSKLIDVTSD